MPKKENDAELKNVKFEDALKRLEKIVEKLEGGDAALEESLSLYEEGISLFKHCSSKLEEAKKKVEILTKDGAQGKLKPQPFNAERSGGANHKSREDEEEVPF